MDNVPANDVGNLESLNDQELVKLYEEFEKKVQLMELENSVFESHFHRVNPSNTKAINEADGDIGNNARDSSNKEASGAAASKDASKKDERTKKKRGDKTKDNEAVILLTPEQKSEVANREVEEMKDEIERVKEKWEKVIDSYKAEMEEIEIKIQDFKKHSIEFKKHTLTVKNSRTGKVIAEKMIRYCEDSIKGKDTIIEKIRLKNSTLKVQKHKLQTQLRQKEEMGEVLHAIDFDQLKIENQQYLSKIEERNNELLKLKMSASRTSQTLNYYKNRLSEFSAESEMLITEIRQRMDLMAKLDSEILQVQDSLDRATITHDKLKKKTEEYKVPEVMEYVVEKALENDLRQQARSWQRKVDVAKMAMKREKKVLQNMLFEEKHYNPNVASLAQPLQQNF